ncbi:DUF480 domain-containing protein [Paraglaciecola sp. 2405UD69-4]|uniref:DUF480 domain-containing protein n=1 Tax=Paraglaciecola sp. 2405UD69-4 TaxID=3391836 RepID=UPI0039C9EC2E
MQLSPLQARVIGVLLEKEITTPDQYPLSLNALTLGCNQKSNREPVMQLTESEVQNTLDELRDKKLIFEHTSSGSRVTKYKHRFCNTEFSDLKFSRQQLAIICVMLLRGPQTPGELRTRTNRLAEFANVDEVETALGSLHNLNDLQLITKLEREPGKRESRYGHLFCGDIDSEVNTPLQASNPSTANVTGSNKIERKETKQRMSRIVIHQGTVYLCGQVCADATQGIEQQTQTMLDKVEQLLADAGSDKEHMLSATIYIKDMQDFAAMNQVWDNWVPEGFAPARACVQASMARPELLVEISVIAAQK